MYGTGRRTPDRYRQYRYRYRYVQTLPTVPYIIYLFMCLERASPTGTVCSCVCDDTVIWYQHMNANIRVRSFEKVCSWPKLPNVLFCYENGHLFAIHSVFITQLCFDDRLSSTSSIVATSKLPEVPEGGRCFYPPTSTPLEPPCRFSEI
jgi:hypothetical protein